MSRAGCVVMWIYLSLQAMGLRACACFTCYSEFIVEHLVTFSETRQTVSLSLGIRASEAGKVGGGRFWRSGCGSPIQTVEMVLVFSVLLFPPAEQEQKYVFLCFWLGRVCWLVCSTPLPIARIGLLFCSFYFFLEWWCCFSRCSPSISLDMDIMFWTAPVKRTPLIYFAILPQPAPGESRTSEA